MPNFQGATIRPTIRPLDQRSFLLGGLLCLLGLSGPVHATPPVLYAQVGLQSPVRAEPDDLLLLAGQGLSASDRVVYRAITDTSLPLTTPSTVPTSNTTAQGVATLASTAGAPGSLTIRLPSVMGDGQSYGFWVRNSLGEWSNGIRINDARPQWISPTRVYASATRPGLSRYLKVVGRNLQPIIGTSTRIRLRGPATYVLTAANDANPTTAYESFVAEATLPTGLSTGDYAVDVSRDGVSWMTLAGQTLKVEADPTVPAQFNVANYGDCVPNDDSDDSNCIVRAITAAAAAGGGDVVFPSGAWTIINGAERAGVETNNGIVVPIGVNLVGMTGTSTAIISRNPCWRRPAWFSLLGRNTVRDLVFRDEGTGDGVLCYGGVPVQTTALQIGKVWYTATPAEASADDITIARNVFDKPWRAVGSGGQPGARLQITANTFGAWRDALFMPGFRTNITARATLDDAIITGNTFMPGSFIDAANGQGATATSFGSTRRLDFSNNVADGAATTYLNSPTDAKGWRAGFFWDLSGPQEQLLLARNTATCTGDKAGDGEAFAYDGNHNAYALNSARTVKTGSRDGLVIAGPLQSVQEGVDISPVLASYYLGHWVRIVQGPGLGQTRQITAYTVNPSTNLVSITVAPAWDVAPVMDQSRVTIARQFWQAYLVDNLVDHRQPLCQKSNANAPEGGSIAVWAQSADSVVENNRQYDTDGIALQQAYGAAGDPACPACVSSSFFQSSLEIRGNLIDGEYDHASPCSLSGFKGWTSSSPTPQSLPPVVSFGTVISHNTFRRVDGLKSGSLELTLGSWGGPVPNNWRMVENALIHHNLVTDLAGAPPTGSCNGVSHLAQQRTAINLDTPVIWRSVLYGNTCTSVVNRLQDKGTATVRVCPVGAVADSCECLGQTSDLAVSAVVTKLATGGDPQFRYTVVVTNISNVAAAGVLLAADVLSGMNVMSLTSSLGSCQANVNTCAIGTLAPGASATVTLTAAVPVSDPPLVTFSATTTTGDANVVNNSTQLRAQLTDPAPRRVPGLPPVFVAVLGLGLTLLAWRHSWCRLPVA